VCVRSSRIPPVLPRNNVSVLIFMRIVLEKKRMDSMKNSVQGVRSRVQECLGKGSGLVIVRIFRIVAILVGMYLLLFPILPRIWFEIETILEGPFYEKYADLTGSAGTDPGTHSSADGAIPEVNTLVIPVVGLEVPIVEGETDAALERGAWRRPNTSTPDEGGNTVITGHRFKYLPPSNLTFYHLDKVEIGDSVFVYWNGKRYDYVVDRMLIVEPDQIEVEADTADPQLTLYTCTPLWTAKQRLVIVATPVSEDEQSGTVPLEALE